MAESFDDSIGQILAARFGANLSWLTADLERLVDRRGGSNEDGVLRLGLNSGYGPGYAACLVYKPLSDASKASWIPEFYVDFLRRCNGVKLHAIELFGILEDDSNRRQCKSVELANRFWAAEYRRLPKKSFHFGSRFYSRRDLLGYFYNESVNIFAARKSGEIVASWPSIEALLREEWEISKLEERQARDGLARVKMNTAGQKRSILSSAAVDDRMAYDGLEYTPSGFYLLDGDPFTGHAYDRSSDGRRISLISFSKGREDGITIGFFPDGKTETETSYRMGKRHGVEKEWYVTGVLRRQSVFEFGVLMSSTEWSDAGEMTNEYVRPPGDHLYQSVEKVRSSMG